MGKIEALSWFIFSILIICCKSQFLYLTDTSTSGWSNLCTTTCGGQAIIGGYKCYGAGSETQKQYTINVGHNAVSIEFEGYWIDSWDGERLILEVNGITRYDEPKAGSSGQVCGDEPSWHDYVAAVSTGKFSHTSSTLILRFTSTLDQGASDESWGFRNIKITVWPNCVSACATCFGTTINECYTCNNGWYLSGSTCVTDCGAGYWNNPSGRVCTACHGSCYDCSASSASSCTECQNSYLNVPPTGSCSASCPDGYYPVGSPTWQCKQCHQGSFSPYSCATCNAGGDNNCQSCNPGSYLHNGQCIYPCPGGYYADISSKKCLKCHESDSSPYTCKTCTGGANNQCTSCITSYYLYQGKCLSICDPGYWEDPNSNCQPCWSGTTGNPYGCKTCSGGGTSDCLSCNTNYFLHPNTGGECLDSCPLHFWGDTALKKCMPCHSSTVGPEYTCYSCDGGTSSDCLSCESGYFLHNKKCLDTCPDGFWGDTVTYTCKPCWSSNVSPYSCVTCNAQSSGSCLKCDSPYFLYPNTIGQCLLTCPDGFWANSGSRTCDSCWISTSSSPYSCKTCLSSGSSNQCTSCAAGAFLHPNTEGECVAPCPDGFWGDTYSNTCQPCWSSTVQPYTCASCMGPHSTNCLSCNPDTFLYQGQCITSCPAGYWGDTSSWECKPCWSSTTSPFTCKTCDAGGSSNCLSCNVGAFQYPMDYGSCLNACPDGFYADNSDWKCKACYSTGVTGKSACSTCFGPLATNCKTCSTPTTFYSPMDKSCVITCPDGYYADTSDYPENQCRKCYQYNPPSNLGSTCVTCNGPSSNQCLSCNSSQFLDTTTNTCVNICPAGWWGDLTSNTCKPCYQAPLATDFVQSCYMCAGPSSTDCTGCFSGSFLYSANGSCLQSCPTIGFWGDSSSHTCTACYEYTAASPTDNTCVSCYGSNPTNCLSCNSTTFLDQTTNTCTFNCPTGYYGDTATNICKSCYSSDTDIMKACKTCSGPNQNNCLSCSSPNYYYPTNDTCLASCPDGWYSNPVLNVCVQCYQNVPPSTWGTCATCSGSAYNNCNTCLSLDYFYDPVSHTCVTSCPAGRYANSETKQCESCYQASSVTANEQSCYTCKGPLSNECLSCQNGHYYYAQGSQCLLICPIGFYPNSLTFTCDSCYVSSSSSSSNSNNEAPQALSCAACTGPNYDECTGCFTGSYLDSSTSTCVNICTNGTYGDNQTLICQPCYNSQMNDDTMDKSQFSCATCYGPLPTQCTSCSSSLALLTTSGTCTDTCPCESGHYYNPLERKCGLCSSACNFCTGPSDSECVFDSSVTLECFVGGSMIMNNQRAQAAASVAAGGSYATAAIAMSTNILSGGITMGASTVLSVLELLGIYQYINVNYPSNMVVFFQLVFAGNPLNFPNLFAMAWQPSDQLLNIDSNVQGNNKFNTYSVSRIFLANSGGDVALVFCLAGLVPFFLLIYHLLKKKTCQAKHKIQKFIAGFKTFLMWNFIITNFMGSFVSTLLSICVQFRYASYPPVTDSFEKFSIFVCVVVTIGYIAFMALAVYVTFSKELPTKKPEVFESVKVLTNEEESSPLHQEENLKSKCFGLALCTRNFFLVPAIAMFSNAPIVQCSLAIFINLSFFVTVSVWKFFASKTKRVIMRICEGLNAVIPVLFLLFGINDLRDPSDPFLSDQTQWIIGWFVIVLIGSVMVLSLLYTVNEVWFILYQLIPMVAKWLKKNCKRVRKPAISGGEPSSKVEITSNSQRIIPSKSNDLDVVDLGKDESAFSGDANLNLNGQEISNIMPRDGNPDITLNNHTMFIADNSVINFSILQLDQQLSSDRKFLPRAETIVEEEVKNNQNSDSKWYSKNKKQRGITNIE